MNKPLNHAAAALHSVSLPGDPTIAALGRTAVPKRVMLVISGRLFRNGIALVLQGADRAIVGDCETLEQVEATLLAEPDLQPDLFVVGIAAPSRAAEDFARIRALRARLPAASWIVLSSGDGPEFWREAVESRVDGMLHEDSPGEMLQLLVKLVLMGYSFFPAGLATALAEGMAVPSLKTGTPSPADADCRPSNVFLLSDASAAAGTVATEPAQRWHTTLSERENDILRGLVAGHSNKLIARELNISEATVKVHVKALLRKMQVTNRTQAAISALQYIRNPARLAKPKPALTLA